MVTLPAPTEVVATAARAIRPLARPSAGQAFTLMTAMRQPEPSHQPASPPSIIPVATSNRWRDRHCHDTNGRNRVWGIDRGVGIEFDLMYNFTSYNGLAWTTVMDGTLRPCGLSVIPW